MSCEKFTNDCEVLTQEQMEKLKTRQLLAHLRHTYRWGDYDWNPEDYQAKKDYQAKVKAILATREHIPNKKESKNLRKMRIRRGK